LREIVPPVMCGLGDTRIELTRRKKGIPLCWLETSDAYRSGRSQTVHRSTAT
jgi:hypothetical protein